MNGFETWFIALLMLPIILITAVTPIVTRKIEAFGVTVQEGSKEQPFLKGMIKSYMLISLLLGVVITLSMLVLMQHVSTEAQLVFVMLTHMFGYLLITFIVYYVNHRKVKQWKQTQAWNSEYMKSHKVMVQTDFRRQKLVVSFLWYIPHVIIVGATMLISILNYDKFPQMIPTKYNFAGEITRSVEKSMSSIMGLSVLSLAMIIVFIFCHISIAKAKQLVESHDPEGSLERNIRFRYLWSAYLAMVGFLTMILVSIVQLAALFELSGTFVGISALIFVFIILFGAILLSYITGQGGSRLKSKNKDQSRPIPTADHDEYWKAGVFYWNPNDPSLFIEKRFGIGWTINFARPLSWIFIVGIIAIVVIPTMLLT